jgi:hypothetical protein
LQPYFRPTHSCRAGRGGGRAVRGCGRSGEPAFDPCRSAKVGHALRMHVLWRASCTTMIQGGERGGPAGAGKPAGWGCSGTAWDRLHVRPQTLNPTKGVGVGHPPVSCILPGAALSASRAHSTGAGDQRGGWVSRAGQGTAGYGRARQGRAAAAQHATGRVGNRERRSRPPPCPGLPAASSLGQRCACWGGVGGQTRRGAHTCALSHPSGRIPAGRAQGTPPTFPIYLMGCSPLLAMGECRAATSP